MKKRIITLAIILFIFIGCFSGLSLTSTAVGLELEGEVSYLDSSEQLTELMKTAKSFVVVKHGAFGGSHYAYTEGLYEESTGDSPEGTESNFVQGSELVLFTLEEDGDKVKKTEYVLLTSRTGCIRDPDVSEDGERIVFSWKKKLSDDFHLYEMVISTQKVTQLTFGSGVADTEPQYLANGDILFSSSRAVQTVDCWKTPVSNLYKCSPDGSNIVRLGYDQVHTTYPTTTSDGRVVYTRWDYNDRTQMWVQGVFQMNADGTNQTELFGNNANFPTTLVHTREVPGKSDLFISIATGHHTYQAGKLVLLDLSDGRNSKNALTFVYPDSASNKNDSVDAFGQSGAMYQYPYAINEELFLVSYSAKGWSGTRSATPFGIYLMDANGKKIELVSGSDSYPCANVIPVSSKVLFERPTMVDYQKSTGTYYVANVYEGEGMQSVKAGTVKNIRVVALDYRAYAVGATVASGSGSADPFTPIATGNGAWDVKRVLGLATVYEDGSAMFDVPSEVPVYFQLLDENGSVIQTMRSWSTLMPGEIYSCVGCHEDNNTAPNAAYTRTLALDKGIEKLYGDVWMDEDFDPYKTEEGFDYLKEVQPILDKNCTSCHNNKALAYSEINVSAMSNSGAVNTVSGTRTKLISLRSSWKYITSTTNSAQAGWNNLGFDDSSWSTGTAGFGDRGGDGATVNTTWNGGNNWFFARKTFTIDDLSKYENASIILNTWYDDTVRFYLNGNLIFSNDGWVDAYVDTSLGATYTKYLKEGENVFAVSVNQHTGGRFFDSTFELVIPDENDKTSTNPVSLEGDNLYANRMKRYFPLSYLVLTGSKPNSGSQWVGNASNKYTKYISSMSQPEVLTANTNGSNKSNIIIKLREGHCETITDKEIRTIAAWIDLCVPCYGEYDANNGWNASAYKEAEEEQNKRDYYEMLNEYARMSLSGTLPKGKLTLTLTNGNTSYSAEGEGIVQIYLERKYKNNDVIKVVLPEGQKYVAVTLNPKLGESLVYCPNGVFEYKITNSYLTSLFPTAISANSMAYSQNYVTARIPTAEELAEKRNLAENVYDINDKSVTSYPHATSDSQWTNTAGDVSFLARNAIDGFVCNVGHGTYPVQSWGPANSNNHWIKIDFGREVTVEELGIYVRYDVGHDTFFKSGKLELSDGTVVNFTLEFVGGEQIIKLDQPIKTTYVKIKNLTADKSGGWAALSEVKVYGHD